MSKESLKSQEPIIWFLKSVPTLNAIKFENALKSCLDISNINYFTLSTDGHNNKSRIFSNKSSFLSPSLRFKENEIDYDSKTNFELFPEHITNLMDEDNYWGCFYLFPELYANEYSLTVRIKTLKNLPKISDGILTKDVVVACLSYLHHNPLLKQYVYIKLNISSMQLVNIDILRSYKYLVYLDISDNLLGELSVLSYLPYLQYLSVSTNRLTSVLDYDTPQWFLTQVYYKNNAVTEIRDLRNFWSITILNLSHNDITAINGLESLMYLRNLDLSFNHIETIENLDNLRLLWLDLSYNNITNFSSGPGKGLCTLLHLEYLNIDENDISSLKLFVGCTRLHELSARNNKFSSLLELALFMKELRRLVTLDLKGNPFCKVPGFKDVVFHTFPNILILNDAEVNPADVQKSKMDAAPNVNTFSIRRLLRMLYVEQLSRAIIPRFIPSADTTQVPLVVLVGYTGVGKGHLASRLAQECSKHVELALLHTTSQSQPPKKYHQVSQKKFDEMLRAGEFLTYSEINGESYGLSREEAFINQGKVKLACMDLLGALVLRHRGRRPYLILCTIMDKAELTTRKEEKIKKCLQIPTDSKLDTSTLQVLVSGRIIMRGILNEIIMGFPDEGGYSEFEMSSQCSLLNDKASQQTVDAYLKELRLLTLIETKSLSSQNISRQHSSLDETYVNNRIPATQSKNVDFDDYTSKESSVSDVPPQVNPKHIVTKTKSCTTHNMASEQSGEISEMSFDYNYYELLELMENYEKATSYETSPNIRDDYVDIHRLCPGFFKDTVTMDNPEKAFHKLRNIIKDIVKSQNTLKPMFNLDFSDVNDYPNYQQKLSTIKDKLSKYRLF